MGLTRAAIARPVFVLMMMLAALIIGWRSYSSMRLELNPDVSFGVITTVTSYPGAGPEEVNNLISRKIEEAISGVEGLREVTSTSREGVSVVVSQLEIGVDVDRALNDIRSKVEAIINQLPKDALKPETEKIDTSATPVLNLAFASSVLTSEQLRDLIDQKLKDRYSQISGVAAVDVLGGDTREVQVRVKRDKLMQYGIGVSDIDNAVAASTLNVPAGNVIEGGRQFTVRLQSEFKTIDEIRNMVFSVSDPKSFGAPPKIVRLSDVADVVDSVQERTDYARLNGKDSISVSISKTKQGNAVDITTAADQVSKQLGDEYKSQGLSIVKTMDTAKQITDSLDDMRFALFFGIALVAIIVYVFLHSFRSTLIVCLAIPTSIFATFIAMNGMGFTINNMSMLSLSLAIGVLVDDAIVVLENITRHVRMGEDPKEAAINGRSEIGLAAIAITMADVVVFTPIGFINGIVGQFFKPLALGFVAATLFSLFVSFTLTPMLASRWYRAGEDLEHFTKGFAGWFERVFGSAERAYRRSLAWALEHRWFVFILGNLALFTVVSFLTGGGAKTLGAAADPKMVVVLAVVGFVVFLINWMRGYPRPKFILYGALFGLLFPLAGVAGFAYHQWKGDDLFKFTFIPNADSGLVSIFVELPPGASLDETQRVIAEVEHRVSGIKDIKYVRSNVGTQANGGFGVSNSGSNYGIVNLTLVDKAAPMDRLSSAGAKLRTRSDTAVTNEVQMKVGRIAGASIKVSSVSGVGFGSPIQMSFTSDDRAALLATVEKVKARLESGVVPGVINVDVGSKPGAPELQAFPDRERLADLGITSAEVGGAMRILYQGDDNTKFRVNGDEYAIRVMMDRQDRDNVNMLHTVPVRFVQGNPVMLDSVANVATRPALNKIDRRNRTEEIQITADLLPGYVSGTSQAAIDELVDKEHLVSAGVNYKPLGQTDFQNREMGGMIAAFMLGLILVYMVLASLFDNLLYPLIIQMAQPQAMVGALLALVFTDQPLSVVGFIGIVSLVGLVGKNAILLVDYTNTLRSRGLNRHDALVEAGPTRLRPISMTTMALVLGMSPVALAIGRGSEFRQTIGITIIGGMVLSTLLTLLVIPCSYTIFDDISIGIGRAMRRLFRRDAGESAAPVAKGR